MGGWIKVNRRPDQLNFLVEAGVLFVFLVSKNPNQSASSGKCVSSEYMKLRTVWVCQRSKRKRSKDGLRAKMDTGVQVQPVKSIEPQIQLAKSCKHEDSTEDPNINLMWDY